MSAANQNASSDSEPSTHTPGRVPESSGKASPNTKLDHSKLSANLGNHRGRPLNNQSYEQRSKARVEVLGIEESLTGTLREFRRMKFTRNLPNKANEDITHQSSPGTEDSVRTPTSDNSEDFRRRPSYPTSQVPPRRRPSWTRTRSGGLWYQKHTHSSSQGSSKSASVFGRKSFSSQRTSSPILPLKPPETSSKLDSIVSEHNVQVEKTFEHTGRRTSEQVEESETLTPMKPANSFWHASMNAGKILFTPVKAFRRAQRRHEGQEEKIAAEILLSSSSIQAQGHKTLLKHQQTSLLLNRVSTILEMAGLHRSKSGRHVLESSQKTSMSSDVSSGLAKLQKHAQVSRIPLSIFTDDELDDVRVQPSLNSSILTMKRGHTPKNTPNDEATYKVKRSASAETEQFLKIDISVRGNTSYLESEARRIHTPPVPEVGPNGRYRGFFFDYNAPWHTEKHDGEGSEDGFGGNGPAHGIKCVTHLLPRAAGQGLSTSRSSSGRQGNDRRRRAKTLDWYDTQLADLDEGDLSEAETSQDAFCKTLCQEKLRRMKVKWYEAKLDLSIPEHLPTSPLCPRHPRYWRVMQHRGSQFRGCWMHGYGIDKSVETLDQDQMSLADPTGNQIDKGTALDNRYT